MRSRRRAGFVLRIGLSYMMTAQSRISTMNTSAISMTNSENTVSAFATFCVCGDELDPDEISRAVKQQPTRAYRKGQTYRPGPRSPEVTGKTGLWYYSTRRRIPSKDLGDHLAALMELISPSADDGRLKELRTIMRQRHLQAHATCFWRGIPGAAEPSIPSVVTRALGRLSADTELDFANGSRLMA
jgi:Domain of unknown function (DUF4279)